MALRLKCRTKPPVKERENAVENPTGGVQRRWGKSTGKDGFLPVSTKGSCEEL
jgi:hypothetical protein